MMYVFITYVLFFLQIVLLPTPSFIFLFFQISTNAKSGLISVVLEGVSTNLGHIHVYVNVDTSIILSLKLVHVR